MGGKEDHLQFRALFQDMLCGPDACSGGFHLNVHENEVCGSGQRHGLDVPSTAGAAGHFHVLLLGEGVAQVFPEQIKVLRYKNSDHDGRVPPSWPDSLAEYRGNKMRKETPPPGRFSTRMEPKWLRTIVRT